MNDFTEKVHLKSISKNIAPATFECGKNTAIAHTVRDIAALFKTGRSVKTYTPPFSLPLYDQKVAIQSLATAFKIQNTDLTFPANFKELSETNRSLFVDLAITDMTSTGLTATPFSLNFTDKQFEAIKRIGFSAFALRKLQRHLRHTFGRTLSVSIVFELFTGTTEHRPHCHGTSLLKEGELKTFRESLKAFNKGLKTKTFKENEVSTSKESKSKINGIINNGYGLNDLSWHSYKTKNSTKLKHCYKKTNTSGLMFRLVKQIRLENSITDEMVGSFFYNSKDVSVRANSIYKTFVKIYKKRAPVTSTPTASASRYVSAKLGQVKLREQDGGGGYDLLETIVDLFMETDLLLLKASEVEPTKLTKTAVKERHQIQQCRAFHDSNHRAGILTKSLLNKLLNNLEFVNHQQVGEKFGIDSEIERVPVKKGSSVMTWKFKEAAANDWLEYVGDQYESWNSVDMNEGL